MNRSACRRCFYLSTGEPKYLQASLNAFRWFDENHMLPYGVTSGEEFVSGVGALPPDGDLRRDGPHLVHAVALPHPRRADLGRPGRAGHVQRRAAPIARDFQTMCYYQSPNRILAESLPGEQPNCPGRGCLKFSRLGYPECPVLRRHRQSHRPELRHPHVDGHCRRRPGGDALRPLQGIGPGRRRTPVTLTCRTDYPFEETIRVAVDPRQTATFPLYFRIPGWCAAPRITVNGAAVEAAPDTKGFVRIERPWSKGDAVTLVFPMSVRVARGYETEWPESARGYFNFMPAEVFKKRRLPYESVFYGPLLFALPIPDRDPNTPLAGARWQFALDNAPGSEGRDICWSARRCRKKWDWPLDAPLALKVPAWAFDWKPTDAAGPAGAAGRREDPGVGPPGALWLHEIPHFHVSRDGQGLRENPRLGSPVGRSPSRMPPQGLSR